MPKAEQQINHLRDRQGLFIINFHPDAAPVAATFATSQSSSGAASKTAMP